MFKVCCDLGHGGRDPGAVGPTGLKEKDVVLAIGKDLQRELFRHGATVVMTRNTDAAVNPTAKNETEELQARCDIANNAKADFFVSIHCNSFADQSANGTETWILAEGGDAEKLAKTVHLEVVKAQGAGNRGIKTKGFYVLKHTKMPAILVENLFISNPAEEKRLRDPEFQKLTAQAIAKGVLKHLGISYVTAPPPVTVAGIDKLQGEAAKLQAENVQLRNENSRLTSQLQQVITDNNALKGRLTRINGLSNLTGV